MTTERKSEKTHALDSDKSYSKCGFMVEDVEVIEVIDRRTVGMLDCAPCAIKSLLRPERNAFERDVRRIADEIGVGRGEEGIASATMELLRRIGGPRNLGRYAESRREP